MDTQLSKVKNAFSQWLHIEDDDFIDVGLATVVAHHFRGDPVWLFLIGASGSAKTEFLRSLNGQTIHHLSGLTANTFVSGLNQPGKKDPSMLADLDGKVIVVKDFTTILNENQKDRSRIFGQLRDIYDGSTAKAFGSGVGTRSYTCHVGFLAGVTPAIEKYQTINQVLGERFLSYRLQYTAPEKAVDVAMRNAGRQCRMREELGDQVRDFLSREWPDTSEAVTISPVQQERIQKLAAAVALFRTGIPKDRSGNILYVPQPEIGTRLVIQFTKLGCGVVIVRGKSTLDEDEYQILTKVARDSLPSLRHRFLSILYGTDGGYRSTADIAVQTGLPTSSTRAVLDDLRVLGIVDQTGSSPRRWRISRMAQSLLKQSELLLTNSNLHESVVQFPGCAREHEGVSK